MGAAEEGPVQLLELLFQWPCRALGEKKKVEEKEQKKTGQTNGNLWQITVRKPIVASRTGSFGPQAKKRYKILDNGDAEKRLNGQRKEEKRLLSTLTAAGNFFSLKNNWVLRKLGKCSVSVLGNYQGGGGANAGEEHGKLVYHTNGIPI